MDLMINNTYTDMLNEKDIIFEIFQYAQEKAKLIGAENILDFSLGNPSVPAPAEVNSTIKNIVDTFPPLSLHGYSPNRGLPEVRKAMAEDLNRKYGCHYSMDNIFMTIGAAGALAHAFRAVAMPGDEIITFAPCFSEYKPYTAGAGLRLSVVPADISGFQINFEKLEEMLDPSTAAVLINSPNNPSGIVYSEETIIRLSRLLEKKQSEYGHPIYLISDEPYRDIIFGGVKAVYPANYYANTLVCYSFSKSISLPGERIGYLAVNPECCEAARIIEICPQISRTIGSNQAATLMQRTVAEVCGLTSELSVYERNKDLLFNALTSYGYSCVEPGGTFYMFPQAPGGDAYAFCEKARELNLMLVPGDVFYCPGHFRIAYCVPTERVERALPVFKALI